MACWGGKFGLLDDALALAAALAGRSPFLSPLEARDEADASRRLFANGTQSDYLAVLRAYREFDTLGTTSSNSNGGGRNNGKGGGRGATRSKYAFARERFLGARSLQAIGALKRQLLEARARHAGVKRVCVVVTPLSRDARPFFGGM